MEIEDKKIFMPHDITKFLKVLTKEEIHVFFACLYRIMDKRPLPSEGVTRAVKLTLLHVMSMQEIYKLFDESEVTDEQ